jgi:hypothetical protein
MSDVSQGPGWWMASDGRWYAPETHPSVRPVAAPPGSAVGGRQSPPGPSGWWIASDWRWYPPETHPSARAAVAEVVANRPGAWGPPAPPGAVPTARPGSGWPPPPFRAPPPHSRRLIRPAFGSSKSRRSMLVALSIVLVVALVAGFLTFGRHHGVVVAQCLPGTCSANPTTVAKRANLQLVELKGFQPPFEQRPGSHSVVASPHEPGSCTPVTGQAVLADVVSPEFSDGPNGANIETDVVILANHEDAMAGLAAIARPGYGNECYKPNYDSMERSSILQINQETPCGLSLLGSTVLPFDTDSTPSLDFRYSAQIHCSLSDTTTTSYVDTLDAVGRACVREGHRDDGVVPTIRRAREHRDQRAHRERRGVPAHHDCADPGRNDGGGGASDTADTGAHRRPARGY